VTAGVTATWVLGHRDRNLIEAIKERPKPASTNQKPGLPDKPKNSKIGSTTNSDNQAPVQDGAIAAATNENRSKENRKIEKNDRNQQTTNDNRDTNNNSDKQTRKSDSKPSKTVETTNIAKEPKPDLNDATETNQDENDGWSVVKEKPKKMKVESRPPRTERSSNSFRRSKDEQFENKSRSNRGDRKERNNRSKKYEDKPKEENEPIIEPPTPDIESESFGPSLGNPFPQSQPLLLQPNMPVSRWADIASK
jgi:hypothetical protein